MNQLIIVAFALIALVSIDAFSIGGDGGDGSGFFRAGPRTMGLITGVRRLAANAHCLFDFVG